MFEFHCKCLKMQSQRMYFSKFSWGGMPPDPPTISMLRMLIVLRIILKVQSSISRSLHYFNLTTQLLVATALLNYSCFNNCYSEVTAYTVLAYSYWASFHDAYECLRHAH